MKDWEKYEDQLFSKLRRDFPDAEIKKNHKIRGLFSKSLRQIDLIVNAEIIGKKVRVVIDCKKFSKKIDVKTVESFIGFLEDVQANMGVMITTVGYTKGAKNRVKNYIRDIRLDIVDFEDFEDYEFPWYNCLVCSDYEPQRFSEVYWRDMLAFEYEGLIQFVEYGDCGYCGTIHIKCNGCGEILDLNQDRFDLCGCDLSYSIEWTNPKDNPDDFKLLVKDSTGKEIEEPFFDPNQTKLFE